MTHYQYIVLPVQGSPYKVHKKEDESQLDFLQDKVDGSFQEVRNPLILHPMFNESWEWVKNLLGGKAKYKVYVNEDGIRDCSVNCALFIKGWSGINPVMGNVLIKMTLNNFWKVKGKVFDNFEEMVESFDEDEDEDEDEE
jgi:hypothetical protein